ncbi:MAG: tetratricopeptide repeat protein [Bacteroidota bacterium]
MSSSVHLQSFSDKIDEINQLAWNTRVTDSNKSHSLSEEAVDLSEKIEYAKGKAEGFRTLGFCLIRLSKHKEAYTYLKQALDLFVSLNDTDGQAAVNEYFGIIERSWGNLGASLEFLFKALALSQQTSFGENLSTNYYQVGVTYRHLGNYEKALDNLYKCLEVSRSANFTIMVGYSINVIGSIYFETCDYARALDYYQQGLAIRRESGDKWGEAGSLDNIGATYIKLGVWEQAIDFCKQSLVINQATGDKKGQANALLHLAEIYKHTDDLQQAKTFCLESLQIRQEIGDKNGEAEILLFLAGMSAGNKSIAAQKEFSGILFKALNIAQETKALDLLGKTHFALYEHYKNAGKHEDALNHLEHYITNEKELHKDAIRQKVLNLEISHKAEESKKEAEIFRLRNVELAGLYEKTNRQKGEIEQQKKNVEATLAELKSTQAQLIQSEKMASLGQLVAGIAHEIQNPLNFVNNFSDINTELIEELKTHFTGNGAKEETEMIGEILNDVIENEKKINLHGKRADAIVKAMLQHSQSSSGKKELTDLNELSDEYLKLSYQAFRTRDNTFNATLEKNFDTTIGKINIIPQDIGRVLLNLFNNAFYAADKISNPTIWISTKKVGDKILITVRDNGPGIPQNIVDKVFQPFFTTKPTGQGTGLGLSLSYDIIKAHGGEVSVKTRDGEGAEFTILLPLK